jgi:sugar O-acyltransferase (sialic acid O-acetyltransferase NeuD family)
LSGLLILGAGGHGKVVGECATALGHWSEIAFLDDAWPQLTGVLEWRVLGPTSMAAELYPVYTEAAVAIGDNRRRLQLLERLRSIGFKLPILIHPSAVISPSSRLGDGSVVLAQAVVNAAAVLGAGVILNTACSVDHDCRLGEVSQIASGARLAGNVQVGAAATIAVGASVVPGVCVRAGATVGAGSVVLEDVPEGVTVAGVPARRIRPR